ncbi:hypothetical protein M378DRAFT_799616 [Amanita muscaria Koide BX008]|uniref:Uncharacterized protein n=1 Tax=Amanita muscaria (strain Koide BX008) TaxID=946122 RepID=A0A0C2SGM2_AMAMK|nr:hypothetical protein M378DRAFT_799616 [Amanita muscaria Koide BX008]
MTGYDARTSVDKFATDQHGYAEPGQIRQNISPSSYKRDHQSEPIDAVPREGRLDNQPRERPRYGQPAREDRVPPTYDNESQSRTRSSSSERLSTRNRPPAQWPPPETRIPAQLPPPEFPPGKSKPPRISEEDRYYRPGKQDHYQKRTEDYMPSPVDDRSRRLGIHSASLDGPYGGRTTEHPPLPPSPDHGGLSDRNHYPPSRQQRPPERARPAEILTPNAAAASSERRTRLSDAYQSLHASGVPDSPDHRAVRRLSVVDRYEPDYGDGYSGVPSRRRPRPANEDSQRTESNHRGDVPYMPGPHHDREPSRPNVRPLLDRLSLEVHPPMNDPTVRDRATIPEKRDRNAVDHDYPMDFPYEEAAMGPEAGEPVAKKVRRRGHKPRRGRRGNGAP